MFLSSTVSENLGLVDAAVIAVLGYAVVFFGLILLQIVIIAMGKYFISKDKKAADNAAAAKADLSNPAPAAPVVSAAAAPVNAAPAASSDAAPGSAGKLKLYDTPPKTAAMIMAIVADKMGKPLNELRFISIKEVK